MLGSEATGHYRPRIGTGSLLTSSLRVVSGSAVAAAVGRETQPHENGRSTFYIDPTAYENEASEEKSTPVGVTSSQSDDLEQEVMSSGEDSGIDGKSQCDDVDCTEEALPAVNGTSNPAMALTRFVILKFLGILTGNVCKLVSLKLFWIKDDKPSSVLKEGSNSLSTLRGVSIFRLLGCT